jgi:hypothetical protein
VSDKDRPDQKIGAAVALLMVAVAGMRKHGSLRVFSQIPSFEMFHSAGPYHLQPFPLINMRLTPVLPRILVNAAPI